MTPSEERQQAMYFCNDSGEQGSCKLLYDSSCCCSPRSQLRGGTRASHQGICHPAWAPVLAQKCSPVLERVPKAEHKYSCLPLLQAPLTSLLGILAGDKSPRQRAGSSVWEQLSWFLSSLPAALAPQIELWLLCSAPIVENPARPSRLPPCSLQMNAASTFINQEICVGRDFHFPSGTQWNYFFKIFFGGSWWWPLLNRALRNCIWCWWISSQDALSCFSFTGSMLTDLIRDYFWAEGFFKWRSRLRHFFLWSSEKV